jgi:hypothetical protein
MTALPLVAAREGCIDETLSALVAAHDVDEEADKYKGVNDDVVVLVKDKLRTIALEEGSHARVFNKGLSRRTSSTQLSRDAFLVLHLISKFRASGRDFARR